ncbi:MAG: Hint domain-containing protein [Pseudomonadota bacterium]
MGWIGLRDAQVGWFKPDLRAMKPDHSAVLNRGSLIVETRVSAETRPQTLLGFRRTSPMSGQFSMQALPMGGIVLVDALGDDICHATLPFTADGRLDTLRLTYSWDVDLHWARLTLERPESDLVHSVTLTAALPMSVDDLRAIFAHGCNCDMDEEVLFVAISDRVEPVGPMPALTAQVPILTDKGEVPAGSIRRGDIVVTDNGDLVPVLQVVRRTVPARGSFRPIRLRAPYFNLSKDIVVAPQQRLVMSGSQVEYMFGREAVLVPARHLVNDRSAFVARGPDMVTYHHLLLPGHEAVLASGCSLESLYVGRLRRKPEALASSVLQAFDRNRLPEHPKAVWPVLKPFEAITLAMVRAA